MVRSFGLLAPKEYEIIWVSNLLTVRVPDVHYSRNASCALHYIPTCDQWADISADRFLFLGYHSTSSQCFDINMVYLVYLFENYSFAI
jgi:hypothetical protein